MKETKQEAKSLLDFNSEDVRSGAVKAAVPRRENKTRRSTADGKRLYFIIVTAVSVVLAAVVLIVASRCAGQGLVLEQEIGEVYLAGAESGEYSGSYEAAGMSAEVSVTVIEGKMTLIELTAFSGIDTSRAKPVFDAVRAAQSLHTDDEDVGTQPTDVILLKAIEDALGGESF